MTGRPGSHRLPVHPAARRAAVLFLVMAALAALGAPGVALRPAAGQEASAEPWEPTPPPGLMVVAAARLSNGKVLAAEDGPHCRLGMCFELYDPALGAWAPVPPLAEGHRALLGLIALPRGRALAMLWDEYAPNVNTPHGWYRYDGTRWTLAKGCTVPADCQNPAFPGNDGYTATVLDPASCREPAPPEGYPCGQVLVVGGDDPFRAHLYSYEGNEWTPVAEIDRDQRPGHRYAAAALLDDGRVLVAGGTPGDSSQPGYVQMADVYDPIKNMWTSADNVPDGLDVRGGLDGWAVRMVDGRVLFGHQSENPSVLFDPDGGDGTAGSWTTVGPCPDEACAAATLLPDGRVLAVGPKQVEGQRRLGGSVLDPATAPLRWNELDEGPAITPTTATLLEGTAQQCGRNCGSVLVAGGTVISQSGNIVASFGEAQLYQQLLQVISVEPRGGLACGGEEVTIEGTGLRHATSVNFGSVSVPPAGPADPGGFVVNENGTITVKSPRHPPGAAPVTVTTKSGATSDASADTAFTFNPVAPATVSGLSEKEGPASGGTEVAIGGTFPAECVRGVRFGDAPAAYAPDPSEPGTRITATSPPGNAGEVVKVSVHVDPGPPPAGPDSPLASVATAPGADEFTYRALPAISSVDPPRAPAFGGTRVVVAGTGFEGATEVRFGDISVPASGFNVNAAGTTITASLPGHDPGRVAVTVSTPRRGASVASPASQLTYRPGISGLFPPSGPLTGGTQVTIAGRGFTGVGDVQFGATSVAPVSVTDTEIVVRSPAHPAAEAVPVRLVASGLSSLPEDVLFTYGLVGVDGGGGPGGDLGAGPPRQDTTPIQPAPPGGTGSPSPAPTPLPAQAPPPAHVASPGHALSPGLAPGQAPSQVASPGAVPPLVPVAGAAPAPAHAAPGSAQAAAGSAEDEEQARGSTRHAMVDAQVGLGLAGAGAAACFSWMALTGRMPARRRRPCDAVRPTRAY